MTTIIMIDSDVRVGNVLLGHRGIQRRATGAGMDLSLMNKGRK
jgi:hypothetical protein